MVLRALAGGTIFGSVTGTATPGVLALHGWARSHKDFDATLAPADGATLDAVALDLPGFGATPAPPEVWGAAEYAAFVAGVLDEMAAPVVVLGHSFGGKVAVALAVQRPEAVRALVLTGVPLVATKAPVQPARAFALTRRAHRLGLVSDARMEAARQRYGSADYRAAEGVMRQILVKSVGEHYDAELARVTCPVELVWGDPDTASPPAVAERAAELLSSARLTVLPGVGHMTPLEAPRELRAALDRLGAR
jgi:pimeloyl-ACP methyl ester carboxylesterase